MPVSKKQRSPCPIDAAIAVVDGRWKGTILWHLLARPLRPRELSQAIPDLTQRMLLRHLQELMADGILDREQQRRAVRYAISPYGMTLLPVLQALCDWGRLHLARTDVRRAREAGPPAVQE